MASPPRSAHFRLETLAPGVHVAIALPDGASLCNAGIVDLGGQTVVFDAMLTPRGGAALALAARRLTGRSPDWVVHSHWHGDHTWGTSAIGAPQVASTRTTQRLVAAQGREQFELARRTLPKEILELERSDAGLSPSDRRWLAGWARGLTTAPRRFPVTAANVTFEDRLVLSGRRRSIELVSFGGGHSPSDVFGYLPDERTIFAGDLVMNGLHPSVGDGRPKEWGEILRRMERLPCEHVLPGHGPVAPARELATVRTYLADLRAIARAGRRRGARLSEVRAAPIPERYAGWGFAFMFPDNLARAFRLEPTGRGPRARSS
ncbi:MAG TPA: MBL fold metallo-hydrolase [Thermoplasmata archaeon]|nr:MBL fold metallo-hydrolase [Thermoplasmata archaeon]